MGGLVTWIGVRGGARGAEPLKGQDCTAVDPDAWSGPSALPAPDSPFLRNLLLDRIGASSKTRRVRVCRSLCVPPRFPLIRPISIYLYIYTFGLVYFYVCITDIYTYVFA